MKTDLGHLPPSKQAELEAVVSVLFEEFEGVVAQAKGTKKAQAKIGAIILYGSYARGGWVEDPVNGYFSDFDILVIVNHDALEDPALWSKAEDRFIHNGRFKTPVQFIVHTHGDVNNALRLGQYFFSDIKNEGIALYQRRGFTLAEPKELSDEEKQEIAKEHFEQWYPRAKYNFERMFKTALEDGQYLEAAFQLHQVTEKLYQCILLTHTNYMPKTHNLKFLRSQAERLVPALIPAWPRTTRLDRARFELLKRAYVEARYSKHYDISKEDLGWLGERVHQLLEQVSSST